MLDLLSALFAVVLLVFLIGSPIFVVAFVIVCWRYLCYIARARQEYERIVQELAESVSWRDENE